MHFPFGNNIKIYIEGGSHDEKIEMLIKGFPAGVKIDYAALEKIMERRRPGKSPLSTARKEKDAPVFTSGIINGSTTGEDIRVFIENSDVRSGDYESFNKIPRPSHGDYSAILKYGKDTDLRGGGHFSGRLTALTCVAGSLCMDFLREKNVEIKAHIYSLKDVYDTPFSKTEPQKVNDLFPVIDFSAGERMQEEIISARKEEDSLGGIIECAVINPPSALGEHMFASTEERISAAVFSVPGVKGIDFGSGFEGTILKGSENNDPFYYDGDKVKTRTNNQGGIAGGITNGMPIIFRAAVKPVPSIGKEQDSVNLETHKNVKLKIRGRHDPSIVPRAVPVIEAAAAIAITDLILGENNGEDLDALRLEIEKTDREITDLLTGRFKTAEKIGQYKKAQGLKIYDREREELLIEKIKAYVPSQYADFTERIYREIFSCSKAVQRDISEKNLKAGLLGKKLSHSFSPLIHSFFASYSYELFETEDIKGFFADCPFDFFNVTIPYKKAVIPYLKGISEKAESIGSVNTVIRKKDGFYGYNTDYSGFNYLLDILKINPFNKKVLILGSGGASDTARKVMEDRDAGEIIIISRTGESNYNNIEKHSDADIIINTTPVGMFPGNGEAPVDLSIFPCLSAVIDMIYNPSCTALLYQAEKRGIPHINGLPMLIKQALDSYRIFTGNESTISEKQIRKEIEAGTKNIVLTGMPGCGKTSTGKIIAEKTGREFIDTDEEIKKITGLEIPEFLERYTEKEFREKEQLVIKNVCSGNGRVIATGGGAVTERNNIYFLKQNSVVVYIQRDLSCLSSEGRPISEKKGIEKLFEERQELYEGTADIKVKNDRTPEDTAEEIIRRLKDENSCY